MIISLTLGCIDIMRIMATESWIMLCYLLLSLARLRCDQSNYPANTSFTNNNNMFRLLGWTKGGPRQDHHGHIFCDGDMIVIFWNSSSLFRISFYLETK